MKPVLQALLLADQVYIDQATGKKVIAGVFHEYRFKRLPQGDDQGRRMADQQTTGQQPLRVAGSPTAYISVTELRKTTDFELRYVDLVDNSILMKATIPVQATHDPLKTYEMIVALPSLPIPHKGNFALELLVDGELIGSHRIEAIEIEGDTA